MSAVFRAFGRLAVTVEHDAQAVMRESCAAYSGGLWNYHELSNGAFT